MGKIAAVWPGWPGPLQSTVSMNPDRRRAGPLLQFAVVAAAVLLALAPLDPSLVEEWFSTGMYLRVQRVLTPLSNVLPVAWLDVLSLAAAIWLVRLWWRSFRRTEASAWPRVGRAAATTVTAAAVVYLAFLALWGLNYRRVSVPQRLVLDRAAPSTEQVLQLGKDVVTRVNGSYAPAHHSGFREAPWRNDSLRAGFASVQQELADGPPAVPGRLKQSLYGQFFKWTAVDGMVNPFGLEVIANPDLLPFERPFVAAHEWAHLAGYADESEANFVGWLTCVRADPASQYSGWLFLYWQISGELPAPERQEMAQGLREGPRADLAAVIARLRRSDLPLLRRASWMMYDSYLKANRVESGVRSYGEVVTLILRARFESGWRPVRRAQAARPSEPPALHP
jgi:hypothetical protein